MITILHGENTLTSRKELERIKENFDGEIINLSGTETDFIQATQSQSLLAVNKLVIVENMEPFDLSKITCDIVFWYDKELSKSAVEKFNKYKSKILFFKIETLIFKFCDSLRPGNAIQSVDLFKKCLKNSEPEYLFIMIVRQFRLMLNPASVLPWQKEKLIAQAKLFGREKLAKIYKKLLEMDFQNKTGQLPQGLSFTLEVFLLSL